MPVSRREQVIVPSDPLARWEGTFFGCAGSRLTEFFFQEIQPEDKGGREKVGRGALLGQRTLTIVG